MCYYLAETAMSNETQPRGLSRRDFLKVGAGTVAVLATNPELAFAQAQSKVDVASTLTFNLQYIDRTYESVFLGPSWLYSNLGQKYITEYDQNALNVGEVGDYQVHILRSMDDQHPNRVITKNGMVIDKEVN